MSKGDSITPFPGHLDRDAFGHWLSGFTDGEGSFVLALVHHAGTHDHYHAVAYFRIKLRQDDLEILETIRSYWQCGNLSHSDNRRSKVANAKPNTSFTVARVADLVAAVVPHFERYPLLAKKRRDFAIWKRAVELLAGIRARPIRARRCASGERFSGTAPKWTVEERRQFAELVAEIKGQRCYPGDSPEAATAIWVPPVDDDDSGFLPGF